MQMNKQVMWVYAAREYTVDNHRSTNRVEVNIPEALPTIPQDNKKTKISLSNNYFINNNFPSVETTVESSHAYELPLLSGTTCPTEFEKGTKFLLVSPTERIEDAYIIYA